MQKIRNFLKKLNTPLAYGISFVVIGLAFILLPAAILDIPIAVIGAFIFLFGLTGVILIGREATANPIMGILGGGTVIRGVIEMFFGLSLMIVRSAVSETVCDALGILIMLYAGFKLLGSSLKSAYHGRYFRLETLLYSILLAVGLFVLIFPLYPKITAGSALIVIGAKLLSEVIFSRGKNSTQKGKDTPKDSEKLNTGDYYTDDFVDKSDN